MELVLFLYFAKSGNYLQKATATEYRNKPVGLFILNGVQSIIATTVGHSGKVPTRFLHLLIECHYVLSNNVSM